MKDYIQRMIDESAELSAKISRGEEFLEKKSSILPLLSYELLRQQIGVMKIYLTILDTRIDFEKSFQETVK